MKAYRAEQAAQDVTNPPAAARSQSSKPGSTFPYGSATPLSSLSTLDFGAGEVPLVLLREPAEAGDPEPVLRPYSTAMGASGGSVGRYQLRREIARGGMVAILKGRDVDRGRELAIKVLLESHRGDSDVVRLFVEEAQIGGQLQHPGIVPVYELGAFRDRRPYFAMKLVKGRTLAALLGERGRVSAPSRDEDTPGAHATELGGGDARGEQAPLLAAPHSRALDQREELRVGAERGGLHVRVVKGKKHGRRAPVLGNDARRRNFGKRLDFLGRPCNIGARKTSSLFQAQEAFERLVLSPRNR